MYTWNAQQPGLSFTVYELMSGMVKVCPSLYMSWWAGWWRFWLTETTARPIKHLLGLPWDSLNAQSLLSDNRMDLRMRDNKPPTTKRSSQVLMWCNSNRIATSPSHMRSVCSLWCMCVWCRQPCWKCACTQMLMDNSVVHVQYLFRQLPKSQRCYIFTHLYIYMQIIFCTIIAYIICMSSAVTLQPSMQTSHHLTYYFL